MQEDKYDDTACNTYGSRMYPSMQMGGWWPKTGWLGKSDYYVPFLLLLELGLRENEDVFGRGNTLTGSELLLWNCQTLQTLGSCWALNQKHLLKLVNPVKIVNHRTLWSRTMVCFSVNILEYLGGILRCPKSVLIVSFRYPIGTEILFERFPNFEHLGLAGRGRY